MKFSKLISVVTSLVLSSSVSASLIGDDIIAAHYGVLPTDPNSTPAFGVHNAIVKEGSTDIICPILGECSAYVIDVEESSIQISHNITGWNTDMDFNGVYIDSLNDSTGNNLIGVIVDTNILNWDSSMLSFDDDSIWINFVMPGQYSLGVGEITLNLNYGISTVPIPGAVWLFGSGLIGLIGVAKRKSK